MSVNKSLLCLTVEPPLLHSLLEREDTHRRFMTFDVEPDVETNGKFRLDINVMFRPIRIVRGGDRRSCWYVGTTGGLFQIELQSGDVREYTQEQKLEAEHTTTCRRKRARSAIVKPKMSIGAGDISASSEGVGVEYAQEKEVTHGSQLYTFDTVEF